ncbi:LytTR family transcriptional regulator DNA-binding domain-containing protein [Hymenobacter coccineus]|uniref:LytTR family transcriptional regulator DNA-binding domain-containing protein n=1 Tax=Hymenobacter coccineus TaxID=1908235 RepID=UPI00130187AF|nr:LytTR family transcriptional regulator DNA-binding domain-containing protein [Hymenobacter coccineus]
MPKSRDAQRCCALAFHPPQTGGPRRGQLSRLLVAFQPAPDYRDELLVAPAAAVAYACSKHKTTFPVRHDGARFDLDETLEQVEASLAPRQGFRLSHQYLVLLEAIRQVKKHFDGKRWVPLAPPPPASSQVVVSKK